MHKILILFQILPVAFLTSEIIIHLTPSAISRGFSHNLDLIKKDLLDFKPPPLNTNYSHLNMTVFNMSITNVKMPNFSHNGQNVVLIGAGAKIQGEYLIVYKTRRSGSFELALEGLDFQLGHGDLCEIDVTSADLTLSTNQPEQVIDRLKTELLTQLKKSICNRVETLFYTTKFYEFTDISNGDKPSHHKVDIDYSTSDKVDTVDVEITESVINAELAKLYTTANTLIHWPVELAENEELTSKLDAEPTIQIRDEEVILTLSLTTVLYRDGESVSQNSGVINAKLTNITISRPKNGKIHWTAEYDIEKNMVFRKQTIVNKNVLESILHKHLRGTLPIRLSSNITWPHHSTALPRGNSLHFHILPHLTKPLRLL